MLNTNLQGMSSESLIATQTQSENPDSKYFANDLNDNFLLLHFFPQIINESSDLGKNTVQGICNALKKLTRLRTVCKRFNQLLTNENLRIILTTAGFDLNILNTGNLPPLYQAVQWYDATNTSLLNKIKLLIIAGANINQQVNRPRTIDHEKTALHLAYTFGYDNIAQILIKAGADTGIKDVCGFTAEDYKSLQHEASSIPN